MKDIDIEGLHLSSKERWLSLLGGIAGATWGVWFVRFVFMNVPVPWLQGLSLIPGVSLVFIGISSIVYAINPKP